MPSLLTRAATLIDQLDDITRDGLVLSPETVEAIGRAEQRRNRWTAVALWAIAALLAVVAWRLFWKSLSQPAHGSSSASSPRKSGVLTEPRYTGRTGSPLARG